MDGRTALHYVACWGDLEVAKSILAPGTETKILFDAEGIGNHSLIELYLYYNYISTIIVIDVNH